MKNIENNPSECFKSGGELNGDSLAQDNKVLKFQSAMLKKGDSYEPKCNRYFLKNDKIIQYCSLYPKNVSMPILFCVVYKILCQLTNCCICEEWLILPCQSFRESISTDITLAPVKTKLFN